MDSVRKCCESKVVAKKWRYFALSPGTLSNDKIFNDANSGELCCFLPALIAQNSMNYLYQIFFCHCLAIFGCHLDFFTLFILNSTARPFFKAIYS